LYLVGSFVLVSLSGCGHGFFQSEEREPWRAEAEIACLKSGAVKEGPDVVRIDPISGPGVCGAEFPLKVAALGESSGSFGFADEDLRPPADIGNQPRWPIQQPPPASQYPSSAPRQPSYGGQPSYGTQPSYGGQPAYGAQPSYGAPRNGPISLTAPGVAPEPDEIELPPEETPELSEPAARTRYPANPSYPRPPGAASSLPPPAPLPPLGPGTGNSVAAFGPVAVKPAATLACPIVSVLDRWFASSVQPAAQRWFGTRVVEIRQISAYSCRGMNGNSHAHISEHAFGNALDIAAFTLADGRRISVKDGWHGLPEEQGFLRDVQAAACQHFTTVLAPGSNAYHYDHIHVDLMRRANRPIICEPSAISGEEVAARAAGRNPYASREASVTGSLGGRSSPRRHKTIEDKINEEDEFADE
jgi:hypothetical protein